MDHCIFDQLLGSYHDGELSPKALHELEAHLAGGCAECAAELEQLRRMSAVLAGSPDLRLSTAARQELYSLAPSVVEANYLRLTKWATGIAAAVLLAGSAWLLAWRTPAQPTQVASTSSWVQVALNPSETTEAQPVQALPDWVGTLSSGDQP